MNGGMGSVCTSPLCDIIRADIKPAGTPCIFFQVCVYVCCAHIQKHYFFVFVIEPGDAFPYAGQELQSKVSNKKVRATRGFPVDWTDNV